jgi:hypothetical protein
MEQHTLQQCSDAADGWPASWQPVNWWHQRKQSIKGVLPFAHSALSNTLSVFLPNVFIGGMDAHDADVMLTTLALEGQCALPGFPHVTGAHNLSLRPPCQSCTNSPSSGSKNEGQPVPLLYFASDENSGVPQPAHTKLPRRFSLFSGLQDSNKWVGEAGPGDRCRWYCRRGQGL